MNGTNIKKFSIMLFCCMFISSCSSSKYVRFMPNMCSVAEQSAECSNHCNYNFNNTNRPLWCYRLFCTNGSDHYGDWCGNFNPNFFPSDAYIQSIREESDFQLALGQFAGIESVNDNNLSFAVALARNADYPKGESHVTVLGQSVGLGGTGIIYGDTGSINGAVFRYKFKEDNSQEGVVPDDALFSCAGSGNCPSAVFDSGSGSNMRGTGNLVDWYYQDSSGRYFSRGSTQYVFMLKGFDKSGVKVMGLAGDNSRVSSYNPMENFVVNHLMNTEGTNYAGFASRFIASVQHDMFKNPNSVMMLNFESLRDSSQLAQGFEITLLQTKSGHGFSLLFDTCMPGALSCSQQIRDSVINAPIAHFSEGILRNQVVKGASSILDAEKKIITEQDIGFMSAAIREKLELNRHSVVVMGAGVSSVSNNEASYGMFYLGDTFSTSSAGTVAGDLNWFKEQAWYKDYNIFQTSGSIYKWLIYNVQFGSTTITEDEYKSGDYIVSPLYYYGNQVFDKNNSNFPSSNSSGIAFVQKMDDSQYLNLAYTGSYPGAFLYRLWEKEGYQTSAGTFISPSASSASTTPAWLDIETKQTVTYLNSAVAAQTLDVTYNPLLARSYTNSSAYNFMVAGALDTTGRFTDGKTLSLALYSNAAGMLKYNYVTVSTSSFQGVLHTLSGGSILTRSTTIPTTVNSDAESEFEYSASMVYGFKHGNANIVTDINSIPSVSSLSPECKTQPKLCTDADMLIIAREKPSIVKLQYLNASPSQIASTLLTAYISRVQELFPNSTATQIDFAIRNSATPMYGSNYDLHVDGNNVIVKQATFYFTRDFDSDDEVRSLNDLNRESGRDVFVFTGSGIGGSGRGQGYDDQYNTMFGSDHAVGTDGTGYSVLSGNNIIANIFGIKYNTSFFTGEASLTSATTANPLSGISNLVQTRVGTNLFGTYASTDTTPVPTILNFDPRTEVRDSAGNPLDHVAKANAFLAVDFASKMDVKFNWQHEPNSYYRLRFIDCTQSTGTCDADSYQKALDKYYDELGVSEGRSIYGVQRTFVNLKVDNAGHITLCSQVDADNDACTYDYQNYKDVGLEYFNDSKNVLLLGVKNDSGQYTENEKKFSMIVYTLDPSFKKPITSGTVLSEFRMFDDLNKLINQISTGSGSNAKLNVDQLKTIGITQEQIDGIGLDKIVDLKVSNDCLQSLHCSQQDLLIMFQLNPNLFVRAPSNVFGYGNVDLKSAIEDITYQNGYFYGNSDVARNSHQLQQFFYSEKCVNPANCGVSIASEIGFNYVPDKSLDYFGIRPFVFRKTLVKPFILADDFQTAIGYVDGANGTIRSQLKQYLVTNGATTDQANNCIDNQNCSVEQLAYINKYAIDHSANTHYSGLIQTANDYISNLWAHRTDPLPNGAVHSVDFLALPQVCIDNFDQCDEFQIRAIVAEAEAQFATTSPSILYNEPASSYIRQEIIEKYHLNISQSCKDDLRLCSSDEMSIIKDYDKFHMVVAGDTFSEFVGLYQQDGKLGDISDACKNDPQQCSWSEIEEISFVVGLPSNNQDLGYLGVDWVMSNQGSDHRLVLGYNITPYGREPLKYETLLDAINHPSDAPGMMLSYVLGVAGPAIGFNSLQQVATKKSSFGSQFIASAPVVNGSVMIGSKVVNANGFTQYAMTNADRNSDYNGYFINDAVGIPSQMVSGMKYTQDLTQNSSLKAMFFGNKNELDLINTNKAAGIVAGVSMYMFSPDQQGMFGNPYLRYAGGFMGSAYSIAGSLLDGRLQYRLSSVQSQNPASYIFGFNSPLGIQNSSGQGMQNIFGFAQNGNRLQELQVMYSTKDNKSSYALSVGFLQQEHGVLSGDFGNSNIGNNTAYIDVKLVQHIGKGFYLMGHYNAGFLTITGTTGADFLNALGRDAFFLQSFSLGLLKDGIFGGSLFFIYSEPNRVMQGTLNVITPNHDGVLTNAGIVDATNHNIERHYEFGYSHNVKGYSLSLSTIIRQNPYKIQNSELDQVVMFKFNGPL